MKNVVMLVLDYVLCVYLQILAIVAIIKGHSIQIIIHVQHYAIMDHIIMLVKVLVLLVIPHVLLV